MSNNGSNAKFVITGVLSQRINQLIEEVKASDATDFGTKLFEVSTILNEYSAIFGQIETPDDSKLLEIDKKFLTILLDHLKGNPENIDPIAQIFESYSEKYLGEEDQTT